MTLNNNISDYVKLYQHLHANPELSFMEFKTAEKIANELKEIGFEITTKFGGNNF